MSLLLSNLESSLVSYLEELVAHLELAREGLAQNPGNTGVSAVQFEETRPPILPGEFTTDASDAAYNLATIAARNSEPVISFSRVAQCALPYYRVFFMSAELPFPLAFQRQRSINVPCSHGGPRFTQLSEEVANRLMTVYIERILPQYPLFSKQEINDMFQRFKISAGSIETVSADEQFKTLMILAIATLSSRAKDHRKLVSVAESLRRDAFSRIDFELSSHDPTTSTIQQLLLLAQYGFLLPSSTNLWQVVGDATRIALELGLHQETPIQSGLDEVAIASRRRLYWAVSPDDQCALLLLTLSHSFIPWIDRLPSHLIDH